MSLKHYLSGEDVRMLKDFAGQLGRIEGLLQAAVGEDGQGGTLGALVTDFKTHQAQDTKNFAEVHARISGSKIANAASSGKLAGIGIAFGSGCGIFVAILEIVRFFHHG